MSGKRNSFPLLYLSEQWNVAHGTITKNREQWNVGHGYCTKNEEQQNVAYGTLAIIGEQWNIIRTKVLLLGPQGQRRPRVGVTRGGLDQKGSVCPTEVVEYKIPQASPNY